MSTLLTWTVANSAMACALALVAWMSRRWLCRPALTHALWVLVLLKFVTPPLGTFALPMPMQVPPATPAVVEPEIVAPSLLVGRVSRPVRDDRAVNTDGPGDPSYEKTAAPFTIVADLPESIEVAPVTPPATDSTSIQWSIDWIIPTLGWLWLAGTVLWFLVATVRLIRFQRVLRLARLAPDDVQAQAQDLADQLGVSCPEVLVIPGSVSPLLWVWRQRAYLVLPAALLERLSPEQWATILTHELAHWRRGDHWVRRLEMLVLGLYWWNPFVWLARRHLHEAEEECCDAWVVTTLPQAAKAYALALVETLDFLAGVPAVLPMGASGVGQLPSLQRRLTMILSTRPQRSLTVLGGMVLAATTLALLPWIPSWAQEGDRPAKKDKGRPEEKKEGFEPRRDKPNPPEGGKPFPPDASRFEAELRKAQEELERAKQQFQDKMREFHAKQPGGPNHPPGDRPFGPGPGPGGPPRGDIEKRLSDVERKLDTLLWELSNLRKEMGPGSRPFRPEGNPPPPPQGDGVRRKPGDAPQPPPDRRPGGDVQPDRKPGADVPPDRRPGADVQPPPPGDGPRRKPGDAVPPPDRKPGADVPPPPPGDGARRRIDRPDGANPPQPPVQRRNNEVE